MTHRVRFFFSSFLAILPACGALIDIKTLTQGEPTEAGDAPSDINPGDDRDATTDTKPTPEAGDAGCGDTTQSADNCGRCGHSCLGGDCKASACQPKMLGVLAGEISSVVVDATHVYFSSFSYSAGAIARVPKNGGAVETYASGADTRLVKRIAVDGTHVYWANADCCSGPVARCPLAGCGAAPEILATAEEPTSIAVDPSFVTWADHNAGRIQRRPLDGGPTQLLSFTPNGIPVALAIDEPSVFWINDLSGEVYAYLPADGGAMSLGANGTRGRDIAVEADGGFVYFSATVAPGSPGLISRVARNGAGGPQSIGAANGDPLGIAIDSSLIYWTSRLPTASDGGVLGGVYACPHAGCAGVTTTVAANQDHPWAIATDATAIYWGVSGGVMKLAKP